MRTIFWSAVLGLVVGVRGNAQVQQSRLQAAPFCVNALEDVANPSQCLQGSTTPTPGMFLPLGPEWFVDPAGNVGLGNEAPHKRLVIGDPLDPTLQDRVVVYTNDTAYFADLLNPSHPEGVGQSLITLLTMDPLQVGHTNQIRLGFWGNTGGQPFVDPRFYCAIEAIVEDPSAAEEKAGLRFLTPNGPNCHEKERMRIDHSGNVGIGTHDPEHPLHMASGAHVTVGGVWTDACSRKWKTAIQDLSEDEALSTLQNLRPRRFVYRVDPSEPMVGFIAEEVPGLVANKSRDGLSAMEIAGVLTKVMQKQAREIEQLRQDLASLRAGEE